MISENSQFNKKSRIYEFGEFRLEAENLLLLRNGEIVQLPIKAVQILLALVEANGRVMKKEEILERVWADTFIEESNLSHHVAALRRALGEEKNSKKFIETIPRRGYRFIAPVTEIESGTDEVIISERTRTQIIEEEEIEINEPIESINAETIAPETSALPQTARKSRRNRRSAVLFVTIAVVALAAIGFAFYKFWNPAPINFEAKKTTRLTSSGRVKAAAISPDGKFIAYSQEEFDGRQSLWMQHIGSESKAQIAAPAEIEFYGLNISPDGNSIYYTNEKGTVYRMPVLGGAAKKLADGLFMFRSLTEVAISPDGKQIAFVRRFEKDKTALFIVNAEGGTERMVAAFEPPIKLGPSLSWSPDGKIIAGWIQKIHGSSNILAVRVADGTSESILPQDWDTVLKMKWLPDSKSLLMSGVGNYPPLNARPLQIYRVSYPSGEAVQITDDTNNYEDLSVTSDGRFLVTIRTECIAHIWTTPIDDLTHARQMTAGFEKFDGTRAISWLPDGNIVYGSSPNGENSTWTVSAGGNSNQLFKDARFEAVSPDNRFIVYAKALPEGGDSLYRMDLNDGSEKKLTRGTMATISPDGKWIVYTIFGERTGLWKVSSSGGEPKLLLDENAICPTISPDGKTVAFVWRNAGQPNRIAFVSINGSETIKTFDAKLEINPQSNKQNLQWTPDGKGVYFVAFNNGVSNIWRQPIDGSPPVQVTDFKDGRIFNFAFSADGKQLALSRGTFNSDVVLIQNAK